MHAANIAWQEDAECQGTGFDFTPDVETAKELEYARGQWCNLCPVRAECLLYALLYHAQGYWGGTTTAERRKLASHRDRVKCPICTSKAVIQTEGFGICQRCGISWPGDRSHLPGEAAG